MTIWNWERNATTPLVCYIPSIIRFLGYDPFQIPSGVPEQLRHKRRLLGLSQTILATRLGVDPTTLRRWEQGRARPIRRSAEIIKKFISK